MTDENVYKIQIARLICGKILTPIISTTGIVANTINMIVLTRSWMKSSTNVYLTAVAASDLIYLTNSLLFSLQVYDTLKRCGFYMYTVPIIYGTANLFSNITSWLTVSFTIERYINISFPIFGLHFCTYQKARVAVLIVCLVSFLFTFPDFLQRQVLPPINVNGSDVPSGFYIVSESVYQQVLTRFGYAFINQIMFVILPLLLLTVFNVLLIHRVLRAHRMRSTMLNPPKDKPKHVYSTRITQLTQNGTEDLESISAFPNEPISTTARTSTVVANMKSKRVLINEQQRITVMLISIVLAFLVLQIPSTILNIIPSFLDIQRGASPSKSFTNFIIFSNISNVLLFVNATMNFVFYSLFSVKFRATCNAMFHKNFFQHKVFKRYLKPTSHTNCSRRSVANESKYKFSPENFTKRLPSLRRNEDAVSTDCIRESDKKENLINDRWNSMKCFPVSKKGVENSEPKT